MPGVLMKVLRKLNKPPSANLPLLYDSAARNSRMQVDQHDALNPHAMLQKLAATRS
jgi:hypothetical protein